MASAPTRRSAGERRLEIVEIAIRHFAQNGYNGTSTDQVAREAGISQPYLFRLFGTKRELFLACNAAMHDRIAATFAEAAGDLPPEERMKAMGDAYNALLADRDALLFQMQSYAACADPEIQEHVREGFATLVRQVHEATGASPGRPVLVLLARDAAQRHRRAPARGARAGRGVGGLLARPARDALRPGLMLDRLAALIYRRRRRFLWGSLAVVLVAGVFGGPVFGLLDSSGDFDDPNSEAPLASRDIARATKHSAAPDLVALVRLGAPADSAAGQRKLDRVEAALKVPGMKLIRYERGGDRTLVSKDGRSSYVAASFPENGGGVLDTVQPRLERIPGVTIGGNDIARDQVGDQVSEDIARAELLAFPILFLLSLFVFRSVVAALLPLAVGGATIMLSFLVMRFVNATIEPMSIYALNLITGLGLGLAIDYSLFVVSRFREELERGLDTGAALRATMTTAGRTVLFSSVTVAAALASLLVFPLRFLYSMGVGGLVCALMAALVATTLLPAILAALGPRVNALSPRRWQESIHRDASGERGGFWYRLSHMIMRRPVPVAIGAATLLIVLGIPFWSIKFTGVDAGVLPRDHSARVVDDALAKEFPPNRATPVFVAARGGPGDRAEVERYAQRLGKVRGVVGEPRVQAADGLYRIDLVARGRPLGEQAKEVVRDVRAIESPVPVRVGGLTAAFLDQQKALSDSLPLALAILAGTTLVILFVMTGSVVLPVKALVMNLLTLSAAFGLLVLIFQDGHLEGLLGFTSQGALESSQPVLLFAVAFGLSTDYGVFLLTRIKEAHDNGASNEEAVALGLERTGRIVTFAALLFVIAIGAFATSQIIFIKQLGVGTALAVLIDATIVRALLVPSLMQLLGDRNWWAPRPLARLHRRIGLSETAPA